MKNTTARLRRAKKTRGIIKRVEAQRISIYKSNQHIYAQLLDLDGKVLASASTVEKAFKAQNAKQTKCDAAAWVGAEIAKKALALNIKEVAFDRSGFMYHGRVRRLAEAAREAGLGF